jgi:tetratricopeptide (TPR) repeat protein
LNPKEPLALLAIGLLSAFEDQAEGIRAFKQVLTDDPSHVEALMWLGAVSGQTWRPEVGQGYVHRASVLDPLHPVASFGDGMLLMYAGDFSGAEELLRKTRRSDRSPMPAWILAQTLGYLGRFEEACQFFDEAYQADPDGVWYRIGKALRHALAGEREPAQLLLRNDLDVSTATHRDYAYALWLAECHALLGDIDGAFEWLERSVDLGMINYPFLNEYNPHLATLRSEPRFRQLMERVKTEWEEFEM